jgi:hypothetical protein
MIVVRVTLKEANEFVAAFHRHNAPVRGMIFAIGVSHLGELVGVAILGRPVSRMLSDGVTAEIVRCCVRDEAPKGSCSFLYRAAWRAWRALGGQRVITYTLASENGSSLRGAAFRIVAQVQPEAWSRPSRGRKWQSVYGQQKLRWELAL